MKKFIALFLLALSSVAMADQCQLNSKAINNRAKILLKKNAEIVEYCKPCGDLIADTQIVKIKSLSASSNGRELFLNGSPHSFDLAYTYVKVAPKTFVNVGMAVACIAGDGKAPSGVPASISK